MSDGARCDSDRECAYVRARLGEGRVAPASPVCNFAGCRVPFPHGHTL